MTKFVSAGGDYVQVSAHNFNKHTVTPDKLRPRLLKFLSLVNMHTARTVYVIMLSHLLALQHSIWNACLKCLKSGNLWLVTLNEAHVLAK